MHRTIQTTDTLCRRATEPKDLQNDTTMAETQSVPNKHPRKINDFLGLLRVFFKFLKVFM
jgi:hypothetical protein